MTSRRGVLMPIRTPLLFLIWFLVLLAVSVVSGAVLANAAIDYSLHDTYYVIAHFHYVLGLAVAPLIFATVYYGLGIAGAPYRELLGQIHFGLFAVGSMLIVLPGLVLLGAGMPQRYVDYPRTFAYWNFVSSAGYAMTLIGLGVFMIAIIDALRTRLKAKKADGL
jgi:cytochrome c oxidase subunit 1